MNEIMIFNNPEFGEVRMIEHAGKEYAVGVDVARALEYANPSKAVIDHCKGITKLGIPSSGGDQETNCIPEGDIYRLITKAADQSKNPAIKEKAERLEHWIFDEVLPSIRKHGAYMTPETLEAAILNPDTIIKIATALKEEQDKRKALEFANSTLTVDNQIMKPKADYFDELVDRNLLTSFRETAKQLEIKERDFIRFLLDKKYIYRDKKGKLMPYADKNDGLFELKETFNEKTQWSGTQTMITPKGRETFRLLYLKSA